MTRADRAARSVTLAVVLAGLLAGCSGEADGAAPGAAEPAAGPDSYVALGDSFSAAPFVPDTDFADGCLRSSGNYPSLVAEELDLRLVDVSCSGAATADVAGGQPMTFNGGRSSRSPQLKAVRPGTDLVTLGIGGNDEGLFQALVLDCMLVSEQPGTPCTQLLRDRYGDPADVLAVVGRRVTDALEAVRRKAPDAVTVLVGYPRLVDADRSCRDFPLAEGDLPFVAGLEGQLNRTLAGAAAEAGAEYLDMHAVSEGHEICSADPWVNGRVTDQTRALRFHPFAEGQQAVADELVALLEG